MPKGAQWMSAAYGGGFLLQGLYFFAAARLLGASQFGRFAGTLALVSIVSPFSGLGGGNQIVRNTSRDPSEFSASLGTALSYVFITAPILGVVTISTTFACFRNLTSLVIPLCISELLFGRLLDLSLQAFQAKDKLEVTARLSLLGAMLRSLAVIVFGLSPLRSAVDWAWLYAAASAGAGVTGVLMVRHRLGRANFRGAELRRGWGDSIAFSVGTASKTVYTDIDKLMLLRIVSAPVSGTFTAAYRLVSMTFVPTQAIVYSSNTAMYRAGESGPSESIRLLKQLATPTALTAVIASVSCVLMAPLVGPVLGNGYKEVGSMLVLLSCMPMVQGLHYLVGDVLMGLGKQHIRSTAQVSTAVLNLMLNLVLIHHMGWRGAVISTYASEILLAACMLGILFFAGKTSRAKR